ncbi:DUF732 domain-containing protein [Mycobacterium servetii]|uniref:DUF732 domain-containing protein n=1 Tax=Mycobacterium servetii TaxID=3237418 RepID=A0ABV4C6H7_9MYCO
MSPSIIGHAGVLAAAVVVLTGGAWLRGGVAVADPNEDAQFLALLEQEQIPALEGVPSLIATAHKICGKLDRGVTVNAVIDDMKDHALTGPAGHRFPDRRVMSTITRFITASVEAYCPGDHGKIVSITAYAARARGPAVHPVSLLTPVLPVGDLAPNPPEIPAPPPDAPTLAPAPRPIAVPPPPKRPPPTVPAPGGTRGGGQGGAPADPSPPMPPGWVRLAP